MSILSFNPKFEPNSQALPDLPVEIRKPDLTLAARGLTSEKINLDPGEYYVTAILPGGQEMYGHVRLTRRKPATVILNLDRASKSPHESEQTQRYIWGVSGYESLFETMGGSRVARLRVLKGNLITGTAKTADGPALEWLHKSDAPQPPGVTVFRPGNKQISMVQLLQPNVPPVSKMLPISNYSDCSIAVSLQSDDSYELSVHLSNSDAETLLRYMAKGMVLQASTLTTSSALQAERLLESKRKDPIAAAVGAYALLRLGALDLLHDWTANLMNWFPTLPDALPIRAEHLARRGDHEGALEALLGLQKRGMPFFSDGLSYALDRLRLYTGAARKHFNKLSLKEAQALLEHLALFAPYVDFGKAIVTITGWDPNNPDDRPLEAYEYNLQEGVDV